MSVRLNAAGSCAGHRWRVLGTTINREPRMQWLAVSAMIRKNGRGTPGRHDRAGDSEGPAGHVFPSLLQPRRRPEHALLAVVREALGTASRRGTSTS